MNNRMPEVGKRYKRLFCGSNFQHYEFVNDWDCNRVRYMRMINAGFEDKFFIGSIEGFDLDSFHENFEELPNQELRQEMNNRIKALGEEVKRI